MKYVLAFACCLPLSAAAAPTLLERLQAEKADQSRGSFIVPSEMARDLSGRGVAQALRDRLPEALTTPPASLDRFPTVRIEDVPRLQQALYLPPDPPDSVPWSKPASQVVFRADGRCRAREVSHQPKVPELHLQSTAEPIDRGIDRCYAQNGAALSQALNALVDGRKGFSIVFDEGTRQVRYPVASYEDLLAAFSDAGFSSEVFIKRTLVDFFGDTFAPPGKAPRYLRLVLWISVPLPDGSRLSVPAEHGDFGIVFTRDGRTRFAESRYFIGLPTADQTAVSFWRPREVKDAPWTASRLEFNRAYPRSQWYLAEPWIAAGAAALRAFRNIQQDYRLPASAYGYYICNDSVALALAKYAKLTGSPRRVSHLFPLLRVSRLGDAPQEPSTIEDDFAQAMGLDAAFIRRLYPSDPLLAGDPKALFERLRLAYPPSDKARFDAFPETRADFERTLWRRLSR